MAHPEHILVAKTPRAGIRDNSWFLRVGFIEPEGKKTTDKASCGALSVVDSAN